MSTLSSTLQFALVSALSMGLVQHAAADSAENDARNATFTDSALQLGFSIVGEGSDAPGVGAFQKPLTQAQCATLADAVPGEVMHTGSWSWAPTGCHWNTQHGSVWFNTHPTGSNANTNYTSVVAPDYSTAQQLSMVDAAQTRGFEVVTHTAGCDKPKMKDISQLECSEIATGTAQGMHVGNWSWAPTGCHFDIFGKAAFYNTVSVGDNGNTNYASVCAVEGAAAAAPDLNQGPTAKTERRVDWVNFYKVTCTSRSGIQTGSECVNIALRGTASQSSTFLSSQGLAEASRAIDGNTSGNYMDGSISATADGKSMWQVAFSAGSIINDIRIYPKDSTDAGHGLKNFTIQILALDQTTVKKTLGPFNEISGAYFDVPGVDGTTGSVVRITQADGYMTLAEVQVFGQLDERQFPDYTSRFNDVIDYLKIAGAVRWGAGKTCDDCIFGNCPKYGCYDNDCDSQGTLLEGAKAFHNPSENDNPNKLPCAPSVAIAKNWYRVTNPNNGKSTDMTSDNQHQRNMGMSSWPVKGQWDDPYTKDFGACGGFDSKGAWDKNVYQRWDSRTQTCINLSVEETSVLFWERYWASCKKDKSCMDNEYRNCMEGQSVWSDGGVAALDIFTAAEECKKYAW
jgi:hypothetical protein